MNKEGFEKLVLTGKKTYYPDIGVENTEMTDEEYNKKLKQDAIDIMSEIMELDNGGVFDQEHVLEVLRKNLPFVYEKGYEVGRTQVRQNINNCLRVNGLALQSDMDKTIEQNLALKKEVERLTVKCEDYQAAMKDYATRFENYVKAFFE